MTCRWFVICFLYNSCILWLIDTLSFLWDVKEYINNLFETEWAAGTPERLGGCRESLSMGACVCFLFVMSDAASLRPPPAEQHVDGLPQDASITKSLEYIACMGSLSAYHDMTGRTRNIVVIYDHSMKQ